MEWLALHRLAAVSDEIFVTSLLNTATPEQHRAAIQDYMIRELSEANRRLQTPSHTYHYDAIKMETSTYSGDGPNRLPHNHWFREIEIAIASRLIDDPTAKVNFLLSWLVGKARQWALGKLVVNLLAFPTLEDIQCDLRLEFEPPQDDSRLRTDFFSRLQVSCRCVITCRRRDILLRVLSRSRSIWLHKSMSLSSVCKRHDALLSHTC